MPAAPYAPDAEERIRYSARHIITATAYPSGAASFDLDVEDATITFDDSTAPRIQASLTCKLPDAAALDTLDARRTFRVKVWAGYKYDSVTEDVQLLADLHVRDHEVKRPANRLALELHSDESLAMDYRRLAWDSQPPQSSLYDAIVYHVGLATIGSATPLVVSEYPNGFGASAVAGLVQEPGQPSWDLVVESARRAGVSIYCEPDRSWRIAAPQAVSGETALNLTTGGGGIIIDSNSVTSRDRFRNAVCLRYRWKDGAGVEQTIYGHSYIAAGPYSLPTIGYNSHYEERDVPVTQAQANQAAENMLRALSRRGKSFVLSAVSAYWLRPGQTVTATLPEGGQERLLVSAASFSFPSGSMQVRLRQPEDYELSSTK